MISPCCGRSLQTGVKWVAVINFLYTLGLILTEVVLIYKVGLQGAETLNPEFAQTGLNGNPENQTETELITSGVGSADRKPVLIFQMPALDFAVSVSWILSWIVDIAFSFLLYRGGATKSIPKCLIWFYFRTAVLVFRIIFLIIYVVAGLSIISKIPVIIQLVIRVYSLWVVNCFINELREEKRAAKEAENAGVYRDDVKDGIENPSFS